MSKLLAGQIANIHVGLGETVLPGAPSLRLAAYRHCVNKGHSKRQRLIFFTT